MKRMVRVLAVTLVMSVGLIATAAESTKLPVINKKDLRTPASTQCEKNAMRYLKKSQNVSADFAECETKTSKKGNRYYRCDVGNSGADGGGSSMYMVLLNANCEGFRSWLQYEE